MIGITDRSGASEQLSSRHKGEVAASLLFEKRSKKLLFNKAGADSLQTFEPDS